jgi:hypothetical protein
MRFYGVFHHIITTTLKYIVAGVAFIIVETVLALLVLP